MLVALLPLAVLVVLKRLDDRIGRSVFISIMTALIVAQLLTSSEVLETGCVFGALVFVMAWYTLSADRRPTLVKWRSRP